MYSEHLRLVARGSFPLDYSYLCFRLVRKLPCTFIIIGSLCYIEFYFLQATAWAYVGYQVASFVAGIQVYCDCAGVVVLESAQQTKMPL